MQLTSALPLDANVYGLGEVVAASGFRRDVGTNGGPGTIQTMWARDAADPVDEAWRLEEVEEGVLLEVFLAALRKTKLEAVGGKKVS